MAALAGCSESDFALTEVRRELGTWMLRYLASRRDGIREGAAAELRIYVGQLARGVTSKGVRCELRTFSPGERGTARVQARCFIREAGETAAWELRDEAVNSVELKMRGVSAQQPSYRAEMGLEDFKEERWPEVISVTASPGTAHTANILCGEYLRAKCRGTAVQGAIWHRQGANGKPAAYLYFGPDVDRTLPDVPVFATAPSYHDAASYEFAELDAQWAPEEIISRGCTVDAKIIKCKVCPKLGLDRVPDAVSAVWPEGDNAFQIGNASASATSVEMVRVQGIGCCSTAPCMELVRDVSTAAKTVSNGTVSCKWKNVANSLRAMRFFACLRRDLAARRYSEDPSELAAITSPPLVCF